MWSTEKINKELAGVTIDKVEHDGERLWLRLSDGRTATFEVEGDCCSRSWIDNVNSLSDGGATFLEYVDGGHTGSENQDDGLLQFYKSTIRTSKGDIDIEYRNESNGYYGGSLEYRGVK